MIAAGSLFTSCVTNTEPQGVKDLREAKADYLASLSKLREADAEKVKAEAGLVQAQAATEQARAALVQAAAKAKEIANDKAEAENAIALEKARKDAEVYLAQQEKVLAEAEEALRAYLVKIEEQSKQLTTAEYQIVVAYTVAYKAVIDKQKAVRDAENYLYSVTYNEKGELEVEAAKAGYEQTIAENKASIATNQAKYDEWSSVAEEQIAKYDFWAAEYQKLQDSIKNFGYDIAKIQQDSAVAALENKEAFDKFFKELTDAQTKVEEAVKASKTGFSMVYIRTKENAFKLPDATASVVTTFQTAVNAIDNGNRISVDDAKIGGTTVERVLSINITGDSDVAKDFIFGNEENPDAASLASIIDALKRDSVVADKLIKDTAGLAAAVAKVNKEYADVKAALIAGVDAYEPIADAKAAAKTAGDAKTAAENKFKADTIDLFKAIRTLCSETKKNSGYSELRHGDSLAVWNAFIDIMKYREQVFDSLDVKDTRLYYKFYKGVAEGTKVVSVKDSVKFSELKFDGVVKDKNNFTTYGGYDKEGTLGCHQDAFKVILEQAFGLTPNGAGNSFKTTIDFDGLAHSTDNFRNTFFGDWWRIPTTGTIGGARCAAYVSKAVQVARAAKIDADKDVAKAKEDYYTDIYSAFWGIQPITTSPADSLKINYSEKTYTDPYVIPVFKAASTIDAIYDSSDSTFIWTNIDYNSDNAELQLIESHVAPKAGKSNLKNEKDYTLYAKTLAAAQIASMAKDYKENSKALAELEEVVAEVAVAYAAAVLKVADAEVVADSVVTAYLGEDIVKKAIAAKDAKTARGIWNSANWQKYIVNVKATDKLKDFTATFCEGGKYKLGGQQLAAAEANIPHYAEVVAEHAKAKAFIAAAQANCTELSTILKKYVDAISGVEGYTTTDDPVKVAQFIKTYFAGMLKDIKGLITTAEENIAKAEGSIQKLEAGFDTKQVTIAYAEDLLAKAQAELEQAELEFAVAEEAYKAVLAAHGITE